MNHRTFSLFWKWPEAMLLKYFLHSEEGKEKYFYFEKEKLHPEKVKYYLEIELLSNLFEYMEFYLYST